MRYTILFILLLFSVSRSECGFVQNIGQFGENVLFFANAKDCKIWISNNSITFDYKHINPEKRHISGSAVSMKFADARFDSISAKSQSNHYLNYFSKNGSFNNVSVYDTVIAHNIYDGIDAVLFLKNGYFAYEFHVAAGVSTNQISLLFEGHSNIESYNNQIILHSKDFSIKHDSLYSYYSQSGNAIKSHFDIEQHGAVTIKFEQDVFQNNIVIDPLVYSTFLGGGNFDYAQDMAIDSSGNIIIVGRTISEDFPTVIGSYDTLFAENDWGFYDVFISKFDSTGKNLIFSTYLGGIGDDWAESVAVDKKGDIYLAGHTISLRSFPYTKTAIDTFDIGGMDLFFTKINSSGDSLIYSTLFGGSGDDFARAIALDRVGGVYIIGYTKSNDFRLTPTAYDTSANGGDDAFVVKFAANSYSLVYSTLIGGSGHDYAQCIEVDNFGNAIIGGITHSTNFPITSNAFSRFINDSLPGPGSSDGFLTKLNSAGTSLIFSTFIGGKGKDAVYGISLDNQRNNIYIVGQTESANFPVTQNSFDNTYNNLTSGGIQGDAFISLISSNGQNLISSTFFGGRGTERASAVNLDFLGNVYITGSTNSINLPTTRMAFQKEFQDTNSRTDAFAAKFSEDLDKLLYSTYIGGSLADVGNSIIAKNDLTCFVSGWTASYDFPATSDAFQYKHSDSSRADVFLVHLKPNIIDIDFGFGSGIDDKVIYLCIGDSVLIGATADGGIGEIYYQWTPINGVATPNEPFTTIKPSTSAFYSLIAFDDFGNVAADSVFIQVLNLPTPFILGIRLVTFGTTAEYSTFDNPLSKYHWTAQNGNIISGQGTGKVQVKWSDSLSLGYLKVVEINQGNCSDSTEIQVKIGKDFTPVVNFVGNSEPCYGDTVYLELSSNYFFRSWSTGETTNRITVTESGNYWVFVSDSAGFGGYSDTISIEFSPIPSPIIYGLNVVRPNRVYSYITDKDSGSTFTWIISGGALLSGQGTDSITVRWNNTASGSLQVEQQTANGCIGRSSALFIDIGGNFKPKIRILGSANICEGESVLMDAGYGFSDYNWSNGETTRFISVSVADTFYCFVQDIYGFQGYTDTVVTRLLPKPMAPVVNTFGNQFTCHEDILAIQWYFNNQIIPGANNKLYIADIPGIYKACITGDNGCVSCSELIYYLVSVNEPDTKDFGMTLYPNPTSNTLNIFINNGIGQAIFTVYNLLGESFLQNKLEIISDKITLDVSALPKGFYLISAENNGRRIVAHFIKM